MLTDAPLNPVGANRLFEYCVMVIPLQGLEAGPEGTPVPVLNELGYYGWELVAILPTTTVREPVGFFRRDLITTPPPPFALTALEPASAVLGDPSFTLRVLGTGFTPDSTIVWNGADEPTTYVTATELQTDVNMATAEVAMPIPVEVRSGTQTSSTLMFSLLGP